MAETVIGNLSLDLDDDVFLYSTNVTGGRIRTWEVFRIHKSLPIKIQDYANWFDHFSSN